MPEVRFDPDLLDRLDRRRKKKRRDSCLNRIFVLLILITFITALFFAWILISRDGKAKVDEKRIQTQWFEQTFSVLFSTITLPPTDTATPTVPTPTVSSTPTVTATVTPTPTLTATPRLRTRTPSSGDSLPSSTPLMLLNAAETEIAAMKSQETVTNLKLTQQATPDQWYTVQGQPGALNADIVYPNANCSWMGVAGQVIDARGNPIIGLYVQVGYFENEEVRETLSGLFPIYGESGYEITIARPVQEIPYPLWIQLLNESHVPVSDKTYFKPSQNCDRSLILINFTRNH